MRLVNIDDCDKELFFKQMGGKDSLITVETAFEMLEALPVVYDVDKVIEKIKKSATDDDGVMCEVDNEQVITKRKAIEIVKAGGMDE